MEHHRGNTLSDEAMQELALLLKGALTAAGVKRLQCIYFRGTVDFLTLPAVDSACMNAFPGKLSHPHAGKCLRIFRDKAPCHQSGALGIAGNSRLEKLSAYCPDLSPHREYLGR